MKIIHNFRGHINRRVLHHGDTSSLLPEQMKTTVTTSSSTLHHHDRHYNNMNNYSHHLSNNVNNCPQHVSLPDSEWGTDRNLFNSNSYQVINLLFSTVLWNAKVMRKFQ